MSLWLIIKPEQVDHPVWGVRGYKLEFKAGYGKVLICKESDLLDPASSIVNIPEECVERVTYQGKVESRKVLTGIKADGTAKVSVGTGYQSGRDHFTFNLSGTADTVAELRSLLENQVLCHQIGVY